MWNFEERSSFVTIGPHIDVYGIEQEVKEAFEEEFGEGEVVGVYASRHPYENRCDFIFEALRPTASLEVGSPGRRTFR
jgi:hypothetical protein